jgi:hypothetical protein
MVVSYDLDLACVFRLQNVDHGPTSSVTHVIEGYALIHASIFFRSSFSNSQSLTLHPVEKNGSFLTGQRQD